jgi:hypothetical protein
MVISCWMRSAFAAAAVLVVCAAVPSHAAEQVSETSRDNARPAIAASADGNAVFVAWDGTFDGIGRRIFMRENLGGNLLPPRVVDAMPSVENAAPAVAVDATGNPHFAWLARVDGTLRVMYRARVAGTWMEPHMVNAGDPAGEQAGAVTLRLDQLGVPWIAYEAAAVGGRTSIRCARLEPRTGRFDVTELSELPGAYGILPDIIFLPDPAVLWYSASDSDFMLVGERFDLASNVWVPMPVANSVRLPAERMPQLIRQADGALAAVWRDQEGGAFDDAGLPLDLVLIGTLDTASEGAGKVALQHPLVSSVTATVSADTTILCWAGESEDDGPQIFASTAKGAAPFSAPTRISGPQRLYHSSPVLAPVPGGAVAAWVSVASEGGNGRVYSQRIAN